MTNNDHRFNGEIIGGSTRTNWMDNPESKMLETCLECGSRVEIEEGLITTGPRSYWYKCTGCGRLCGYTEVRV